MKYLHVVAAVISGPENRILIAKRKQHAHQGGLWEFPGGKVDSGESPLDALKRELFEELDIHVSECRPLIKVHHHYPDKSVCLDVWLVSQFVGEPIGKEGQPVEWVSKSDLSRREFPEANKPILKAIALPDCYAITADSGSSADINLFRTNLRDTLVSGIKLIQLRLPSLSDEVFDLFFHVAQSECSSAGASLVVNRSLGFFESSSATALHLNSRELMALSQRPNKARILGASCHTVDDLQRAQQLGCDYVSLSPVCTTSSHPSANVLGWEKFEELVSDVNLPVYALGGLSTEDRRKAWSLGGQGVCGISQFWLESKTYSSLERDRMTVK